MVDSCVPEGVVGASFIREDQPLQIIARTPPMLVVSYEMKRLRKDLLFRTPLTTLFVSLAGLGTVMLPKPI